MPESAASSTTQDLVNFQNAAELTLNTAGAKGRADVVGTLDDVSDAIEASDTLNKHQDATNGATGDLLDAVNEVGNIAGRLADYLGSGAELHPLANGLTPLSSMLDAIQDMVDRVRDELK